MARSNLHGTIRLVVMCLILEKYIQVLAQEYRTVKFCKIKASDAKVSEEFIETALPVLLAYKNNEIIGNFVQLSTALGDDFFATDVEIFLQSYGLLPEKGADLSADSDDAPCEADSDHE